MNVAQTARDHPIKVAFGTTGSVIAIVAALFALDGRYAHAADVEKAQNQIRMTVEQTTLTLRKQMIEDKLFELDIKREQSPTQRLSPIDTALQGRYKRQLEEIHLKQIRPQLAPTPVQ